jgi:aminopeptidase YwaD
MTVYRIVHIWMLFVIFSLTSLLAGENKSHNAQTYNPTAVINPDPYFQEIINRVSADSIYAYLQKIESFGVRTPGSQPLLSARNWIHDKMIDYGYDDVQYHDFNYSSSTLQNIITTKAGTDRPDTYFIIDGHYDSINGPGVNDNGSGTAILLEVARVMADIDTRLSLRLINFSAEEQGLIGSTAYVNNVAVPNNLDLRLILNIDEVGGVAGMDNNTITCERDEGNPSGNNAASALYTDSLAAITQAYTSLNTQIAHAYASDYMPFEDAGYVITGYYETNETPYAHTANDVLANMDPAYVLEVARATVAAALHFAQAQAQFLSVYHQAPDVIEDNQNATVLSAAVRTSGNISQADLSYRVDNGNFTAVAMEYQWQDGDTLFYQGSIPAQAFGSSVDYNFVFSSDQGVETRLPENPAEYFSYTVAPDTVAPAMVHVVLSDQSYLINPIPFELTATDKNGITSVEVYVKRNNGAEDVLAMNNVAGDRYTAEYTDPALAPGDVISYRFRALDGSPAANESWMPEQGYLSFELLNSERMDFEITAGGFSGDGDWQWGVFNELQVPAGTGQSGWATNLAGTYNANTTSQLLSPVFDLTGKTEIRMIMEHFYQIEPVNDGGNVKISVDGGDFTLITPLGGYPTPNLWLMQQPGYSGNSYFWQETEFDLTAWEGHSVQFRFDFQSDVFTNKLGWYIQEVRLDFRGAVTNHLPVISHLEPAILDSVALSQYVFFHVSAQDADGDSLSYRIQHGNDVMNDSTVTFTFLRLGADTVTAFIDDGVGETVTHQWIFTVYDPAAGIDNQPVIIQEFALYPAYPNPFNPQTVLEYSVPKTAHVVIEVYSVLGEKIKTLISGEVASGMHRVTFDASELPSGAYFVVMDSNGFHAVQRVLLIR